MKTQKEYQKYLLTYHIQLNSSTKKSCIVYSCICRLCIRVCIFVYLINIFIFRVCIVYFANFLIVYSRVFKLNINYRIFIFFMYCLFTNSTCLLFLLNLQYLLGCTLSHVLFTPLF